MNLLRPEQIGPESQTPDEKPIEEILKQEVEEACAGIYSTVRTAITDHVDSDTLSDLLANLHDYVEDVKFGQAALGALGLEAPTTELPDNVTSLPLRPALAYNAAAQY